MSSIFYPFIALVVIGSALAGLTIWSRRMMAAKVAALALTLALFGTGYATAVELLGRPKPIQIEWWGRDLTEARVIAAELREDEAIYLWLAIEGVEAPVSYALPWSLEAAKQLNGAMEEAEEEGVGVQMRSPFNASPDDQEPMFYAEPQPALPPKA